MCYVDVDHQKQLAIKRDHLPQDIQELGVTNSFGMPSMDQEFLKQDIQRAKDSLLPNQALVVSFVGTPSKDHDFYEDFVQAALIAKASGGTILEANFSCPNVATKEGSIYKNPKSVLTSGRS